MIGRKEEVGILEECLKSPRPEFLTVYGRRRVGKTYLVKEFFNNTFSFYATGVPGINTRKQLRIFNESLQKYGDTKKTIPKDWFEAFSRLETVLESSDINRECSYGKRVVFLDELPWMDTARSDFKSALDWFWNSWGSSQKDLLLIVCGSATSWILNNIVKDTGGFYNRVTRQIHLQPFSLRECEGLLKSNGMVMTRRQVVECYMVFGGIPYYLNYLKTGRSLSQNIEMLLFSENAPLRFEFQQLYSSLFKNADHYIQIIRVLSDHRSGMTRKEILEDQHTPEGRELTKCLNDLEQCGFIRKYRNFTKKNSEYYFQLVDSFTLFYMTFMETGKVTSWMDFYKTPAYYNWCGLAFEKVCLLHTKQIKTVLGVSGVSSQEFSWRSEKTVPGAQIDLLIDRKDDVINVCEMKYSLEKFAIDAGYEEELLHKIESFREETRTGKALHLTMVTFSGLKQTSHKNEVVNELTGEDLFVI